jgi:NAD(P)-dependent dehydrogenase (short-subunit alcohol dehydrogenase family)
VAEPTERLFDLSGRVALVTGATRGLGLEMARAFAQAGAAVVVVSRKAEACEQVAAELRAGGARATRPRPLRRRQGGRQCDDRRLGACLRALVRVNAIMPGPFLTPISRGWDMDLFAERARAFPLRRAGDATEIVGAALYLASDASSYTTGTILTVDGGARWS